jgi:hypothetical protein
MDANILNPDEKTERRPASNTLAQVSADKYTFDRRQPHGKRIVSCSRESDCTYSFVLEGQVVESWC